MGDFQENILNFVNSKMDGVVRRVASAAGGCLSFCKGVRHVAIKRFDAV